MLLGKFREVLSKRQAVARFVAGQAQRADELVFHARERGLMLQNRVSIEDLERNTERFEHSDILAEPVELRLRSEQLQRPQRAVVVGDIGLRPQVPQTITAYSASPPSGPWGGYRAVVQLRSIANAQRHIAGSRVGLITRGRCRINSHLIAFNGTPGPAQGAE
jgi:hypothetical protein